MSAVVYRMYGSDDSLLYIGSSVNLAARLAAHGGKTEWYGEVARISVQHMPDRAAALDAERTAIAAEQPRYNVRLTGRPQPARVCISRSVP